MMMRPSLDRIGWEKVPTGATDPGPFSGKEGGLPPGCPGDVKSLNIRGEHGKEG